MKEQHLLKDGSIYCEETQHHFKLDDVFWYFYKFDGSIRHGRIGLWDHKNDDGFLKYRQTIDEAVNDLKEFSIKKSGSKEFTHTISFNINDQLKGSIKMKLFEAYLNQFKEKIEELFKD